MTALTVFGVSGRSGVAAVVPVTEARRQETGTLPKHLETMVRRVALRTRRKSSHATLRHVPKLHVRMESGGSGWTGRHALPLAEEVSLFGSGRLPRWQIIVEMQQRVLTEKASSVTLMCPVRKQWIVNFLSGASGVTALQAAMASNAARVALANMEEETVPIALDP